MTPSIDQIVPVSFLSILIVAVVFYVYSALKTGSISFGYKYYPPGHGFTKKESPIVFWSIVVMYGFSVLGCSSLVAFIVMHPMI